MESSLKTKITTGFFWNLVQLVIEKSASFIIKLVLAKLLFPEQFGLIGMATIFTGLISTINELGIATALIQRKKSELTRAHLNTAFWTSIGFGVLLFLFMSLIIGPFVSVFYREPILKEIIPFLSISLLVRPLVVIHTVLLNKELNFKRLSMISNITTIVAGIVSVIMAYAGFGVWSLVMNALVNGLIVIPFYWFSGSWRPNLEWNKDAFKDIFGFGVFTLGTSIINYAISNVDYLLVGKMLGPAALGAYTFAFILTDTFRAQLMSMINKVMYPVYSLKQDNIPALKQYYLKVVLFNMIIVYPIMLIFIIYGEDIIITFFNNKWQNAILPLKILSLSVLFHMVVNSNTSLIRALGYAKLEMKIQLYKSLLVFIPSIVIGIYFFGIVGAAYAVVVNKLIAIIIAQSTLKKLVNLDFSELMQKIGPVILISLFCLALGFSFKLIENFSSLFSAPLIVCIYFSGVLVFYKSEFLPLIKKIYYKYV